MIRKKLTRFLLLAFSDLITTNGVAAMNDPAETLSLPQPHYEGKISVEAALQQRRSIRELSRQPLSKEEISQLLWAAQGVTHGQGFRTAPSAGALYPLELYLVIGQTQELEAGVYKYQPHEHTLLRITTEDRRNQLARAALGQDPVRHNGALLVFSGVEQRTARKYGQRGARYMHIEVGHAAQNVLLQAISLGLGAVVIGAFEDKEVARILEMPPNEQALYLLPVGRF
ncbi:nitroreductase [Nitrosococcus halophilus Nc 4]|uniref:Nitroreductase n=1 Tax=Nitrosococcus halophilus (strain Nc4) TaxID=472759 RepID=D5C3N0_NITHN|nr:SagB/ThcOx family dehydrogenase [Nitrosococcus halophilus]ADE15002.1 nitroreductase [Nitrosococcus halophilus Nc 4]